MLNSEHVRRPSDSRYCWSRWFAGTLILAAVLLFTLLPSEVRAEEDHETNHINIFIGSVTFGAAVGGGAPPDRDPGRVAFIHENIAGLKPELTVHDSGFTVEALVSWFPGVTGLDDSVADDTLAVVRLDYAGEVDEKTIARPGNLTPAQLADTDNFTENPSFFLSVKSLLPRSGGDEIATLTVTTYRGPLTRPIPLLETPTSPPAPDNIDETKVIHPDCLNPVGCSIGGTTELLVDGSDAPSESSSSAGDSTLPIAAAAGGALVALAIAGLYVRRRIVR